MPTSRIFVPLCGKSLDILWLARQGHEVVGVELSPIAIEAFFEENELKPRVIRKKKFSVWRDGRIRLLCGDFFKLAPRDLGAIDVVYDRAALTALPERVRKQYAAHMRDIVPLNCRVFLLTIEDGFQKVAASLLSAKDGDIDEEIKALYGPFFVIKVVHTEEALEPDPSCPEGPAIPVLKKVYRLHPK